MDVRVHDGLLALLNTIPWRFMCGLGYVRYIWMDTRIRYDLLQVSMRSYAMKM